MSKFLRNSVATRVTAAILSASTFMSPVAMAYESNAKQAILVDVTGRRVLYEKNADQHMPTSSMSKMMTIYMVFDALKAGKIHLDDEFTVSEHAWRQTYKQDESSMFLPINGRVKVEDLVRGVVIQSGNDATVVLAEGIGGSESQFVDEMNEKAKQIGLSDSHFMNPHGMPDPNHYSTARDLATLAERLVEDFPEYYHFFGELEYTYNNIKQGNRNPLLYHAGSGADGLKTGHTDAGGYGLTGSAIRDGRRLIVVVNGLPSMQARADDPQSLLDYGFNEFKAYTLFKAGETVEKVATWEGVQPFVPLVIETPVTVTLNFAEKKGVKAVVKMPETVKAPIEAGQLVGKLVVSIPGMPDEEFPLKTASAVERLGFFPRIAMAANYLLGGRPEAPQPEPEGKKAAEKTAPKPIPPSSAARKAPALIPAPSPETAPAASTQKN
ncbi:MAG: D-alanyl-D-alanine carboxypeptidase [Rhodospirillales bacterium]|nr:D-alanyl-D-alanine carboxypeptidase [Rhodospirillales bacterium]